MDRRHFAAHEIRFSGGSEPKIQGYAATFNMEAQLPGFVEVIRPGAFDRAIREKQDVVCLFNHNENFVLGRTTSGTLRIEQDRKGLYYTCDLPDTQAARDLHESIKRRDVNGCSFAFTLPHDGGQTWTQRKGDILREITDLNLHDVSPVVYPCYQNTNVDARVQQAVAEIRSRMVDPVVRNNSLQGWRIEGDDSEWRVYDESGRLFNTITFPANSQRRFNNLILEL